jgi:hypothetical protein
MSDRRKKKRMEAVADDRRKKPRDPQHPLTRIENVTYHVMRRHNLHKGGTVR